MRKSQWASTWNAKIGTGDANIVAPRLSQTPNGMTEQVQKDEMNALGMKRAACRSKGFSIPAGRSFCTGVSCVKGGLGDYETLHEGKAYFLQ